MKDENYEEVATLNLSGVTVVVGASIPGTHVGVSLQTNVTGDTFYMSLPEADMLIASLVAAKARSAEDQ